MYEIAIIIIFVLGYAVIILEHPLKIHKSATALLTGVLCWLLYAFKQHAFESQLAHYIAEIAGILFFLLGAMTIVELIDLYDGFRVITDRIKTTSKRQLLVILSLLTFFLSAVLDNLTTAIVMTSILRKLIPERSERMVFAGLLVVAANAGGAWSPIGDVTTTMLWIGGQVTTAAIIGNLLIPSLVCLAVPLLVVLPRFGGDVEAAVSTQTPANKAIFFLGVGSLISVPVLKGLTGLPPYMCMMLALGFMWLITEIIERRQHEEHEIPPAARALQRIDTPSILFFLGILLAVSALSAVGLLNQLATWLNKAVPIQDFVVLIIGLLSAVVDNVPLVAAAQGMYDFPTDHKFWEFLAYAAGTGGSILIIGSAPGVAVMGMENLEFFWYLKRIGWLALLGYLAGALTYLIIYMLEHQVPFLT